MIFQSSGGTPLSGLLLLLFLLLVLVCFRNCIGQEFALNEEKVILSHILRSFVFTIDEAHEPVMKEWTLITRPKNGLFLKMKRRDL